MDVQGKSGIMDSVLHSFVLERLSIHSVSKTNAGGSDEEDIGYLLKL